MANKKTVCDFRPTYSGRTFFFFGKATKPIEDLPTLDPRTYIASPEGRKYSDKETGSDKAMKAVEMALEQFKGKEYVED